MLLNHTSGLFNYSEDKEFGGILEADIMHPFTPRQLVAFAIKNKPYFPPGKGFHYSNTNTVLLGMIVGKVAGVPLERQIKDRFIDKLALKKTYFPRGAETGGEICRGYMLNDKGKIEDWTKMNVSWGWAAGAMISDIYDLKTFVTSVTNGSLLSKDLQRERMSSWVELSGKGRDDFPTARYGYNVFTFGGFIGHNGGLPGCISFVVRNPKNGVTLVMMMNIQPKDTETSLKILKEVIGIVCPGTKV
jgi:D-alanyl-D-alanine carboxypeptidase